jgi:hypothetical protein
MVGFFRWGTTCHVWRTAKAPKEGSLNVPHLPLCMNASPGPIASETSAKGASHGRCPGSPRCWRSRVELPLLGRVDVPPQHLDDFCW